ncbi:MAG: hypothetical protein ACHP84_03305 [Caulobacterales bacterium]
MHKIFTAAVAAMTIAGSAIGVATPVSAQDNHWRGGGESRGGGEWRGGEGRGGNGWRGEREWRGRGDGGDDVGIGLAAGLMGLAFGAALANNGHHDYRDDRAVCVSHREVWDPYIDAYVVRTVRYAC